IWHGEYAGRWIQTRSTLPMVGAFPLLGVGLGAYRDIYFRYQPAALDPGKVYFGVAHNDLLQLVVELGLLGAALVLFAAWRVGQDLVASHLLGRSHCPVGGGEAEGAQRSDPFSVGLGLGALGAVLDLAIHSGFDFSARVAANGILAAACLGIATVALHTRFSPAGERLLTATRTWSLGRGRLVPLTAGALVLALSLVLVPWIVRPPLVDARLRAAGGPEALGKVEEALALHRGNVTALAARARLRLEAARRIWNLGQASDGRVVAEWEERRREAVPVLMDAIQDLRTALARTPTDPFLHEALAWTYGTLAVIDPAPSAAHLPAALTSLQRAIALAPENPFLYRSLAALALTPREPLLPVALRAAREAVQRDPALLPDLVDRFVPMGLTETQWVTLVPDSALDRLQLGALLEARALWPEAAHVYRRALEPASPAETSLGHWRLARLLMRQQDYAGAIPDLDAALRQDPENPELHLARAQALAARGDPTALEAYRAAVLHAEARTRERADGPLPFGVGAPRARALVVEVLGPDERIRPLRYRRALAQYLTDRKLWLQALREWEAVLAEAPRDPAAHSSRGVALDGLGARDQALEAYRQAVALDGRSVLFRLRLAERLWETDQYYQAINEWRAVLSQEPGHVEARLALARAYVRIGERVEAFRQYQRVLQITPDQPEARRGLARLGATPGR
ncbi:MAG: tetratricopeptide repeat protein, partial [Candidatus Rokuibacteriota bacterium]